MKATFAFILVLLVLLFLRFYFYFSHLEDVPVGEEIVFEQTFLQEPRVGSFSQYFRHGDLTVYLESFPRYKYGDVISVLGVVEEREVEETGEVRLVMPRPTVAHVDSPLWLSWVAGIRGRVVDVFQRKLGWDEAGLLLGIVFGVREGVSEELSDVFRGSGVLHVVAASGANIALVGGFLMALFGRISSRAVQVVIVVVGIAFYAILSGGEASILRASVMGVFAYSAAIFGRQYSGYFGLFLAVFILLMVSPSIWEDVGFFLSVSSTFGILLFQLPMNRVVGGARAFGLFEDLSTSVAATVGNLPVLLYFFGTYPLLSIVVNVLVLWTVPYLMILGGVGAVVGLVWEVLSIPFLYLALPLLKYFLWVVQIFPQDVELTTENFSIWFVLGYYCLLFAVIMGWRKWRSEK